MSFRQLSLTMLNIGTIVKSYLSAREKANFIAGLTSMFSIVPYGGLSTGTANAYVVTLSPAPTALTVGLALRFCALLPNTGACTLNVNGLGAKSLKYNVDQDLVADDIKTGQMVQVVYDGTNFQMV